MTPTLCNRTRSSPHPRSKRHSSRSASCLHIQNWSTVDWHWFLCRLYKSPARPIRTRSRTWGTTLTSFLSSVNIFLNSSEILLQKNHIQQPSPLKTGDCCRHSRARVRSQGHLTTSDLNTGTGPHNWNSIMSMEYWSWTNRNRGAPFLGSIYGYSLILHLRETKGTNNAHHSPYIMQQHDRF